MPEQMTEQDAIEKLEIIINDYTRDGSAICQAIDNAINALKQPTIEPEVRRGRWNYRHEDDWCYCTACGTDAEGSDGECLETDYCPHCGAKMYADGGTISKERYAEIIGGADNA